ncbi:MAG TPA: hypothetical protein VMB78_03485 [Dissulfurispiraceae bacterium]|nr:hypothetical protein [Dissulfurispiraceae bacterium]
MHMKCLSDRGYNIQEIDKNFSHVDEAELSSADINEGIDSTINIVQNEIKNATLKKEYGDVFWWC